MNQRNNLNRARVIIKKNERYLEILSAIAILIVMAVCFNFSLDYVSGGIETKWATSGGTTFTNYSLLMFLLLAINGCGVVWIVYKYAKRSKLIVSMISVLILSLVMAMSNIFLSLIPIIVCLIIFTIFVRDRKIKKGGL